MSKTKLTSRNYFTPKNRYLSNSKMNDWVKCKEYFYKKHISHEIVQEPTPAMILGSAVDCIVTENMKDFEKKFDVKVLKKDDPKKYEEQKDTKKRLLTEVEYQKAIRMASNVIATDAYKEIKKKKYKAQQILSHDTTIGEHFKGLCCIPDWIKVDHDKGHIYIIDLKTTQDANRFKYHRKCIDFGYYRQAAIAVMITRLNNPEKDYTFTSQHLVVEKDPNYINRVYTFELDRERIEQEILNIEGIIEELNNEKDFLPKGASWSEQDVIHIGELKYD